MESVLHIIEPKAFIILHNWTDVLGLVWEKDYRKQHGSAKTQMLPFDRQPVLSFSQVQSPCAFRYEKDAFGNQTVAITSKGLLQLVVINALKNGSDTFNRSNVKAFLVDRDAQEQAGSFVDRTLPSIIDLDSMATMPDDPHRHAARRERDSNGRTWQRLGVIGSDERLPEPEPLPFNGKYPIAEMVEHDKRTGLLAREMVARALGDQ